MSNEEIKIYRERGGKFLEIGVGDKETVHSNDLLHKSAHILMVDLKGNIFCRKRANTDERYAGLWTTTIGTHVLNVDDYEKTLVKYLPAKLKFNWIGEFRVHDNYENEINGLYKVILNKTELPKEFLKDRKFISPNELVLLIKKNKTTPHLANGYNLFKKA